MTIEQERKLECWKVNCQYYEKHCTSFSGYNCSKLGGSKVPHLKSLGRNYSYQTNNTHSMKPKFLRECDGWSDEGR